ncbi:MAG: winged helix-turn-helix transcriptional regulator [Armatimonadetes bacterium]|nr:winged helix-turn-helix transcriptional regulator [Candidatus Hippobium faecium]
MSNKEKVTEFIIDNINNGKYTDGTKIMSENMLSYYLKVTKYSVREALKELEEKNIIYKVRGSGNFIKLAENSMKYIIVSINEEKLFNENTDFFARLLEQLKTEIKNKACIPYIHLEHKSLYSFQNKNSHFADSIPIDLKDIKGLISIGGFSENYKQFEEREIPIVSLFNKGNYPFVDMSDILFYDSIRKLLRKYSLNRIAVFSYSYNTFLINKKNNEKLADYTFITVRRTNKFNEINKDLEKGIRSIKDRPDAIVFLDDTIYTVCQNLFPKYKIFSDCPIITHSNGNEIYSDEYRICRFVFNAEDYAIETIDLLMALIDRKISKINNRYVTFKTENEEALKNQVSQ